MYSRPGVGANFFPVIGADPAFFSIQTWEEL